jgi:sugar (pentulose or hexulose) kinase
MKENFLVIDIGTQSLRASIVDKKGDILLFSQQKYEVAYNSPEEGFAEQDVDYYIQKLCDATNDLKNKDEELFSTILGMDVVDFRDSSIILDKDKKPIRPAILWLDQRVTLLHGKNLKAY